MTVFYNNMFKASSEFLLGYVFKKLGGLFQPF